MRGDRERGDKATVLSKFLITGCRGQANVQIPRSKYQKPNAKV